MQMGLGMCRRPGLGGVAWVGASVAHWKSMHSFLQVVVVWSSRQKHNLRTR